MKFQTPKNTIGKNLYEKGIFLQIQSHMLVLPLTLQHQWIHIPQHNY